jgi:hypothetical protein
MLLFFVQFSNGIFWERPSASQPVRVPLPEKPLKRYAGSKNVEAKNVEAENLEVKVALFG